MDKISYDRMIKRMMKRAPELSYASAKRIADGQRDDIVAILKAGKSFSWPGLCTFSAEEIPEHEKFSVHDQKPITVKRSIRVKIRPSEKLKKTVNRGEEKE